MFRLFAHVGLLTGIALGALGVAQPALAYVETGTTGRTGAHSLTDTSANPGAVCEYQYSSTNGWMLHHMTVAPPKVKAASGQGNEKVAWKFLIQRQDANGSSAAPWKTRYTSPKFVAHTDTTHNASFSSQGTDVEVPYLPGGSEYSIYRVSVKLLWYKPNGDVLGTATERVEHYDAFVTPYHNGANDWCADYYQ